MIYQQGQSTHWSLLCKGQTWQEDCRYWREPSTTSAPAMGTLSKARHSVFSPTPSNHPYLLAELQSTPYRIRYNNNNNNYN